MRGTAMVQVPLLRLVLVVALLHAAGGAGGNGSCVRRCGGMELPYPFGFSGACTIQLGCDDGNGTAWLGDARGLGFAVRNITSERLVLDVRTDCSRPLNRSLDQLFTRNLAPSARNWLLLSPCRGPEAVRNCTLLPKDNTDRSGSCTANETFGCLASSLSRSNYLERRDTGCSRLVSSTTYGYADASGPALLLGKLELDWWVEGNCACSSHANCTPVATPNTGQAAFRCECLDGFEGDGYADGAGCRKAERSPQTTHLATIYRMVLVTLLLLPTIAAIIFIACLFLWRRRWRLTEAKQSYPNYSTEADAAQNAAVNLRLGSMLLDISTLRAATGNFAESNKLGQGGFGAVYKGTLLDGDEIAVKRLSKRSSQGVEELKNEVELVAKLKHKNLVRLVGVCLEQHEKLIVYEFVPNRSLDLTLFDTKKRAQLDWGQRYKIINGIARGLQYLHEDSQLKVVHRDLKASNVLLDLNMNPKISDFGFARLFARDQTQRVTKRVIGTYGYMAPEYVMGGNYSVKSDTFSFGVMVLEIVTGRKNIHRHNSEQSQELLIMMWEHWTAGTVLEMIDPCMGNSFLEINVLRCVHIGLLCVQGNPVDRPVMSSVVMMLGNDTISLNAPSKPAFYASNTQRTLGERRNKRGHRVQCVTESV